MCSFYKKNKLRQHGEKVNLCVIYVLRRMNALILHRAQTMHGVSVQSLSESETVNAQRKLNSSLLSFAPQPTKCTRQIPVPAVSRKGFQSAIVVVVHQSFKASDRVSQLNNGYMY